MYILRIEGICKDLLHVIAFYTSYLFTGDRKNKRAFFDHRDLNDELYYVSNTWNLDENTAMLHTLSLYHTFGIVATLMSPLSVGGSVVILPQFDTLKVLQSESRGSVSSYKKDTWGGT